MLNNLTVQKNIQESSSKIDYDELKKDLLNYCNSLNLDAVGIGSFPLPNSYLDKVTAEPVCPFTSGEGLERLNAGTSDTSLICGIVVLFPYYIRPEDLNKIIPNLENSPNLSTYTWGKDYHIIVRKYLTLITKYLETKVPSANFEIHVDTSPLCDRQMAFHAGLGFIGENHCLINPKYGSYVSIGTILTSIPLPCDSPLNLTCLKCNACNFICPGQALQKEQFLYERCKSYITQKKGELSPQEISIMQKTPLIFGCDECQRVCPHNAKIPTTPIPEFLDIMPYISPQELENMTNKEFKAKYGDRAFSWRGKRLLLRNNSIINKKEQ